MGTMKILLLNYCHVGQGTYHRCYNFGRHLGEKGFEVELICNSPKSTDLHVRSFLAAPNFRVTTLPSLIRHGSATGYLLRTVIGSVLVLLRDFDVLHSFGVALPSTSVPTLLCRLFRNKKIVLDWDDAWGDAYGPMFSKPAHRVLRFLEENTPKWVKPDYFTVVSDYFVDRLRGWGFANGHVARLENGSNPETIHPVPMVEARKSLSISPEERIVLTMGHNYFRSLDTLYRMFEKVLALKPDARLYVVGEVLHVGRMGGYTKAVLDKFRQMRDRVVFCGEVPFDRLKYYLGSADVLVLPMENSTIDVARAPIRLGDYLASGKPIVSNAVGYVRSILKRNDCSLVSVDPDDVDEFAENVLRVLNDSRMGDEMGVRARSLAENELSWSALTDRLTTIYRAL
jgi:glycosyltransferase involved in cell wall biosynthesis